MNKVDKVTQDQLRTDLPEFRVGDTIKVDLKINEGNRERIQSFEGLVMAIQNGGVSKTFTVRKDSYGVGVERTIPFNSPKIAQITVIRKGKVRQAKLGYIRNKVGHIRIPERKG